MHKIRVLHIRSSGGFYGAEGVILVLAKEMRLAGIDSRIGIIRSKEASRGIISANLGIEERAKKEGIETVIFPCSGKFDYKTVRQMREYIQSNSINIVHSHGYKSTLLGLLASWGLPVKRVVTNHLWDYVNSKVRAYQFLEGVLFNYFDKVIAVSSPIAKDVRPFLLDKDKLLVIANGIDTEKFRRNGLKGEVLEKRREFGIEEDEFVVGIVGRLARQKGHEYLLRAFAQLSHKRKKLLIVGDGALKEHLKAVCNDLGLPSHLVTFAGIQDDMSTVYEVIDIVVMPSLEEGLPMALLEAMAMEKAVIAADVGDISKLVVDGDTGILIKPRDTEAIVTAINRVLENRKDAITLGKRACEVVRGRYSSKAMGQKYLSVYEKCLGYERKAVIS